MVQIKQRDFYLPDHSIHLETWLSHLAREYQPADLRLIQNACALAEFAGSENATPNAMSCLQEGLAIAEILHSLKADSTTLAASLVYSCVQYADLDIEDVQEQLGKEVSKLIQGVERLAEIRFLHQTSHRELHHRRHLDNMRQMLIAMVEDVRVVLIKLAEQTVNLHAAPLLGEQHCKTIAQETLDIYAPLANRLGVNQIKWQLEDLAFRYFNKEEYHRIAKSLDSKRVEREQFVQEAIDSLHEKIKIEGIEQFEINGRAKHIYSIYRKMQRKKVGINEIYDALAVRVLVENIEDCYAVLGIVHSLWKQIPKEFDDYIATPKPNGYRSIHTAVIGPGQKNLEVQIRTFQMHKESELGVAAHWAYKEGAKKPTQEGRIAWLREVLDWQKELISQEERGNLDANLTDDRIYVLTPRGEVKDLPLGATPLDFAYQIHSEVGHRCRGAKVNGKIVPLNYHLQTGEQVEILTGKHAQPSRDWMNPHLGYLTSSRARARVFSWFKQQDYQQNRDDGHNLLKAELNRLNLSNPDEEFLLKKFHYKSSADLYAALGCGDLRVSQIIGVLQTQEKPQTAKDDHIVIKSHPKISANTAPSDITISGVGNLLTHIARCCQPLPGEAVIGFITRGRGVSIHRQDCANVLHASESSKQRLVSVEWEATARHHYPVDIVINAHDRRNLVRDVTAILSNEHINLVAISTTTNKNENSAQINLTIEIDDLTQLSRLLTLIQQLPNVTMVRREQSG
ncbi:MAG: GTP diphosphokinase [Legionellales bacterium]|nr:GTP diphosphokinase [Legionellales bacterium]